MKIASPKVTHVWKYISSHVQFLSYDVEAQAAQRAVANSTSTESREFITFSPIQIKRQSIHSSRLSGALVSRIEMSSYADASKSGHHCNCTHQSSFSHDPFCDPILRPSISNSLYPDSCSDPFPFNNPFNKPSAPSPPLPPKPKSKVCPAASIARLIVNPIVTLTRRIRAGVAQLFSAKRKPQASIPDIEEYGKKESFGTENSLLDIPESIRGPDKTELDFLRREQENLMRNRRWKSSKGI